MSYLAFLFHRSNPWLRWWQEIILNWVSTWSTISVLIVASPDDEHNCQWNDDYDAIRAGLEQLLQRDP
jgi:hypothetical protein